MEFDQVDIEAAAGRVMEVVGKWKGLDVVHPLNREECCAAIKEITTALLKESMGTTARKVLNKAPSGGEDADDKIPSSDE